MSKLNLSDLENFFQSFKLSRSFKKNDLILQPDTNPTQVYYLQKGYIRLYSLSESGKEITFNIFKPGSFFSMIWAIGEMPNAYFFEAMTDVEVLMAPKEKVVEYLKQYPDTLFDLTRRILVGMSGFLNLTSYLLFGSARARVAAVLLVASKRFGDKQSNGETVIELPLTHQTIASMAGLTRETTTTILDGLKKENLIDKKEKQWVIKDMKELDPEMIISKEDFLPEVY